MWCALFRPAKTPAPVVNCLNTEIAAIVNLSDVRFVLSKAGLDAASSTPVEFNAVVKKDYPRGSNGFAQALIDARTLVDQLFAAADPLAALKIYEQLRLAPTAKIVQSNRTIPPNFIILKADVLSGGKPFRHIDDLISQEELRQISENYAHIAGFARDPVGAS